jgi:FPC/CPF motif-containing protein YcgG
MTPLFKHSDIATAVANRGWERVVFAEFESAMTSRSRPFPCVFGVAGFKADRLRFAFVDPLTPEALAPILRAYLAQARTIGPMTSLVIFGRPGPVQQIDAYRDRFWGLLDGLAALDDQPWPAGYCDMLDTPSWEFCFAGEPMFVVCNTPAHVLRQSRRASSFMITFQPRWVFDGITDSDDPAVLRSLARVRDLLADFDAISPAPSLGKFGAPENREFAQYFIDDTNEAPACPFHRLGGGNDEQKGKVA